MSDHFRAYLDYAAQLVSTWPAWQQTVLGGPVSQYKSRNGVEPGSEAYKAEVWMLQQGMLPIDHSRFPHLYTAMLNEYARNKDKRFSIEHMAAKAETWAKTGENFDKASDAVEKAAIKSRSCKYGVFRVVDNNTGSAICTLPGGG